MDDKTTISITISKKVLKEAKLKMVKDDILNRSKLIENLLKDWVEKNGKV